MQDNSSVKNILITGASGFIGSFLVEEALTRGWNTWAGIRKSSSREYLQDNRIRFVDLNFADKTQLAEQLRMHAVTYGKWDYIIHNAGVTKCLNPEDFDRVNYLYTRNLVEALIEIRTIPEKFILMSSLSAFPDPETAYGRSKRKAERLLQTQQDIPYIILRPTGVYGPREKDYYLMVKTILSGFDVSAGFQPQKLTFIYVTDLVRAAFLAVESPLSERAYNIAEGNVYTNDEYTGIVKKVLGKKRVLKIRVPLFLLWFISVLSETVSRITKKPSTLNRDKFRIMRQRDWTCDTRPVEQDLGFKAGFNLERGIETSVKWYRENKWL